MKTECNQQLATSNLFSRQRLPRRLAQARIAAGIRRQARQDQAHPLPADLPQQPGCGYQKCSWSGTLLQGSLIP